MIYIWLKPRESYQYKQILNPSAPSHTPNHLLPATIATPKSMDMKTFPVFRLQIAVHTVATQLHTPPASAAGMMSESKIVPGKASMNFLKRPVLGNLPANSRPPKRKP